MSKFAVFGLHGSDLFYVIIIIKTINLRGYQEHSGHIGKGYPYH